MREQGRAGRSACTFCEHLSHCSGIFYLTICWSPPWSANGSMQETKKDKEFLPTCILLQCPTLFGSCLPFCPHSSTHGFPRNSSWWFSFSKLSDALISVLSVSLDSRREPAACVSLCLVGNCSGIFKILFPYISD